MASSRPDHNPRPPRVVIDAAVVMSALLFGGGEVALLRRAWQTRRCRPMVSQPTVDDLVRKLNHPGLGFSDIDRQTLLAEYLAHALRVRLPELSAMKSGEEAPQRRLLQREPEVMAYVRLAMAGRAHALVTADAELLSMNGRFVCPVLSVEGFASALQDGRLTRA